MNRPILIGKAQEFPIVSAAVQAVSDNEGFYIATDVTQPGAEIPLVSIGGKIHAMEVAQELVPEKFYNTVRFNGPFRAPVSETAESSKLDPAVWPKREGMRQDLFHALTAGVTRLKAMGDPMGYHVVLEDLIQNLSALGSVFYKGDMEQVDEFLQHYCLDSDRKDPS